MIRKSEFARIKDRILQDKNPISYNGNRILFRGENVIIQASFNNDKGKTMGIAKLLPDESQKLHNHSPCGFNWGYSGSGPAQLALALLFDTTQNKTLSLWYYQDFKRTIVAKWQDEWTISQKEILAWLEERLPTNLFDEEST